MRCKKLIVGLLSAVLLLGGCSEERATAQETVIQETAFFKVTQAEQLYTCTFFDKDGTVVKTEEALAKEPHVESVDEGLIRFTYQAGLGIGTQWGYYYDTENERFSDVFQSILDQNNGLVAYLDTDKVVMRDIFDENEYIREFDSFEKDFSPVAAPIVDAFFLEEGTVLEITYLAGSEYEEVTEQFNLK